MAAVPIAHKLSLTRLCGLNNSVFPRDVIRLHVLMDLNLEWGKPLPLVMSASDLYWADADQIPHAPGVYVFFRQFGKSAEALYVGKATNLRTRIKQQLNAHRLMKGIEGASIGSRYIAIGELKRKPGQQIQPCLALIEHALIRHFLANGDELLNIHGSRIRKHSLTSERTTGRNLIPKVIYFE